MTNTLFKNACLLKNKERPPIWFMRQAGRYLPEYRALRKKYSFLEMIHTPDLACEVTLQPLRRFGFDAAILYSDILVVSDCFGLHFDFIEGRGPVLRENHLNIDDLAKALSSPYDLEKLQFVFDAITTIKPELSTFNSIPLIGFCGSPFTVSAYLIEKGSSKDHSMLREVIKHKPDALHQILSSLTSVTIDYLKQQITSGVEAIQLFDTWASLLSGDDYYSFSLKYIELIVHAIQHTGVPIIIYSKNSTTVAPILSKLPIQVMGVDWDFDLSTSKVTYPKLAFQGNLNPHTLKDSQETALEDTKRILNEMKDHQGFIFNLGHGILPQTPLENVELIVNTVKSFKK